MEVYSFGNGDFLYQVFLAISNLMGTGSFMTLVRITIMLSMLVVGYQLAFSMRADHVMTGFFKHYFVIIMLFYALMVPKTDVIVWDEYRSPHAMTAVNNVPLGVALFANVFTTVERGLTTMMETSFSTPNDLKFGNSGFAFSAMALDNMKYATTSDPYFKRMMDDFVVNCFFTDILWGDKDLNVVLTSNNIFAQLTPTHSAPLMSMKYDAAHPMGQQDSCSNIYSTISTNMGAKTSAALSKLSDTMGLNVSARLPSAFSSVLNVATTAQGAIQQALVANSMKDGLAQTAMYTGVSGDAVAYATSMAQQQQQSQWAVAGELSKKYIPILRQILEAIVYGIFPILFLMMMSPWAKQALQMYVSLLIWLVLWSPLFALLNLIVNTRTTGILAPASGYFSMGYMPFIYQSTADVTAMAGYMAWLVPTLAFAIAKMSDSAMVHAMSSVASSTNMSQSGAARSTTGSEGATRAASTAAQFQAANIYGSSAVMSGVAAQQTYSMQYGMAMDGLGMPNSRMMGQDQVKSAAFGARSSAASVDTLTDSIGGGDSNRAATIAGTTGGQRQAGDLKSLQDASAPYGGIESFSRSLADKNYAQASSVIGSYAQSRGISFGQGAQEVGRIMGDREAVGAEAFKNVQSTVSRDGQVQTETNKGLNEAAKFNQAYEFASAAGYAGSKDDFQGMYNAHSAHHGQESWTLDGARAGWLNNQAEAQGSSVRFASGDRVSMARTPDGNISLAKGESGMSRDSLNISQSRSGNDISNVQRSREDLNLGPAGMTGLANELRGQQGYGNFVKALDKMAASGGGVVHLDRDPQTGQILSATAGSGGSAVTVDHSSQKTGWEKMSQAINKGEFGSQFTTKDINEKQVSHGTVYSNPQTVLQMVNSADKSFVAPSTHANTAAARDTQIKNAAAQLAGAQASFATSQGKNAHTAIAGAFLSAGLGTPSLSPIQAKAGVDGRVSIESRFEANYNTMTQANQQALSTAIKQGEGQKLTGDKLDTYVANKMQEYNKAFHQNVDKEQGFGAARPGELIRQATEKFSSGSSSKGETSSYEFIGP